MTINPKNYDFSQFLIRDGIFCGLDSVLIVPDNIGIKFTQVNKIFRSSIWLINDPNKWTLLSASYPKFCNFGENPENFPVPTSLDGCIITEKIDGSLCCIDYVNNLISMRTRGTFSVDTMENVNDFTYCLNKYPKIEKWLKENPNYTLITEITTPNLRIVIRYGDEPDFWLTGAVNKDNYSLMTQSSLDDLATELELQRPNKYTFSTLTDLISNVDKWIGKEGVCLYSRDSQQIWKIKGEDYLTKHRLKEEFGSIEKVLDFYIAEGQPDFKDFQEKVAQVVDFETATEIIGDISRCVDARKEVDKIISGFNSFVNDLKTNYKTRKDQALKVLSSYSTTNRSSMIFKLLDGKVLDNNDLKKLYWQVLKA